MNFFFLNVRCSCYIIDKYCDERIGRITLPMGQMDIDDNMLRLITLIMCVLYYHATEIGLAPTAVSIEIILNTTFRKIMSGR